MSDEINLASEKLTKADLRILFSMIIKLSETCKSYETSNFAYGWDEHSEEREYFQERLKAIKGAE